MKSFLSSWDLESRSKQIAVLFLLGMVLFVGTVVLSKTRQHYRSVFVQVDKDLSAISE